MAHCDFCYAENPRWLFPVSDVEFLELGGLSIAGWAACEECRADIDSGNPGALRARGIQDYLSRHPEVDPFSVRRAVSLAQNTFHGQRALEGDQPCVIFQEQSHVG